MLTINANFNRKIPGTAQYSSDGYSCSITAEVDDTFLHDPDALQDKLKYLYKQCSDAVEKQISGGSKPQETKTERKPADSNRVKRGQYSKRGNVDSRAANGRNNGYKGRRSAAQSEQQQDSAQAMTDKQRSYIEDLAHQSDIDSDRLHALCNQMFNSSFQSLSKLDASSLLSTLKDVQSGKISVATL